MWIIFVALFVIGLLAIIANTINLIGEIIKPLIKPLFIFIVILFVLACIFC